jgi:Major Facilitator Superfamily
MEVVWTCLDLGLADALVANPAAAPTPRAATKPSDATHFTRRVTTPTPTSDVLRPRPRGPGTAQSLGESGVSDPEVSSTSRPPGWVGHRVVPRGGTVSVNVNVKQGPSGNGKVGDRYKWVALINTTLGIMMATIDGSIMLISLPDIFRGIRLDPLQPGNSFYLLWMILSFLVVTSVLVVNLGRLGDIYGRVRMYNLGFAIFTFFSLLLTVTWLHGAAAGLWLIIVRVFQGIGAAFLVANSSAILTDAFPEDQRGMALGINQAAAISGTFIGLVLGGVLAPINWRLIFLVSVPIGLFGTVWGYLQLREVGRRTRAQIDWPGNLTFAFGLISLMIGITYGIEPNGGHTMGWTSPAVRSEL